MSSRPIRDKNDALTTESGVTAKRSGTVDFERADNDRWNHSTHYHDAIFQSLPANSKHALDIGCGEGLLTRQLRERIPNVVGIDTDAESVARAVTQSHGRPGLSYLVGDALTYPFDINSFDVVTAINTIHQVDPLMMLRRMAELVRPGGLVAVIGVARRQLPRDLPYDAVMFAIHLLRLRTNDPWDHGAPAVNPKESFVETRRIAKAALPGVTYRRRIYGRYTLFWTRPF